MALPALAAPLCPEFTDTDKTGLPGEHKTDLQGDYRLASNEVIR